MRFALLILATSVLLSGCFTVRPDQPAATDHTGPDPDTNAEAVAEVTESTDTPTDADPSPIPGELSAVQRLIVAAGREVLETQSTTVGDVTYPYDCSGTILTVYAHAGLFFAQLFYQYSGNGVRRLHGIAIDNNVLHDRSLPAPGDIIFWDNTYDRNSDGQWNDPLTHAGLVLSVAQDGTVEFLHHNYRRGIVTASMNLLEPEVYRNEQGSELNSPMRMASQRASNPDLWLSSHLFREFGSMYLIDIEFAESGGRKVIASNQ